MLTDALVTASYTISTRTNCFISKYISFFFFLKSLLFVVIFVFRIPYFYMNHQADSHLVDVLNLYCRLNLNAQVLLPQSFYGFTHIHRLVSNVIHSNNSLRQLKILIHQHSFKSPFYTTNLRNVSCCQQYIQYYQHHHHHYHHQHQDHKSHFSFYTSSLLKVCFSSLENTSSKNRKGMDSIAVVGSSF